LLENLKLEHDTPFFVEVAEDEGFEQISSIFKETADNEREHSKLFFRHLRGGMTEISATYPVGIIGETTENLVAAAEGEKMEWGTLYPNSAEIAEKEGFKEIARTFQMVAKVEKYHERHFRKLVDNVKQGKVFKKGASVNWKCRKCGYVHESVEAPQICPACYYPNSYF